MLRLMGVLAPSLHLINKYAGMLLSTNKEVNNKLIVPLILNRW